MNELKKLKLRIAQKKKQTFRYEERLTEMDSTIMAVRQQVRKIDENLVRRALK